MYPFPVAQILKLCHAEFQFVFCVCMCREGGYFYVVFCNAIFSKSELNTKSFSCQTHKIWKNIFIEKIYNANIFKVAC